MEFTKTWKSVALQNKVLWTTKAKINQASTTLQAWWWFCYGLSMHSWQWRWHHPQSSYYITVNLHWFYTEHCYIIVVSIIYFNLKHRATKMGPCQNTFLKCAHVCIYYLTGLLLSETLRDSRQLSSCESR